MGIGLRLWLRRILFEKPVGSCLAMLAKVLRRCFELMILHEGKSYTRGCIGSICRLLFL